MMTERERLQLEEERERLVTALRGLGNLMRGTLVDVAVRCGRPRCACATGAKHPRRHLSVTLEGRTRTLYLGPARESWLRPLLVEYQRAWALINGLTTVNLALARGVPARRRGRRR